MEEKNLYKDLIAVDVSSHIQKKNGLNYLSWAWAWSYTISKFPSATFDIWKDEQGRPYIYDEKLGYMVFTKVTIEGETREMWLPVMDGANKAMKDVRYAYKVKEYKGGRATGNYIDKYVEAATMFDINTAIMRCLVKNLALFGLGLTLYAGEDLPTGDEETDKAKEETVKEYKKAEANPDEPISEEKLKQFVDKCKADGLDEVKVAQVMGVDKLADLTNTQAYVLAGQWSKIKGKIQ